MELFIEDENLRIKWEKAQESVQIYDLECIMHQWESFSKILYRNNRDLILQ
jgi:hypothetical protein